jgi:hypothetical protein
MVLCAEPTTPPAPCSSPSSFPQSEINNLYLSDQPCKFTPDIPKKAPRAWERKPATPFAPRSESHKIWKRCKQNLDRKCATREREFWRTVKRMRTEETRRGDEDEHGYGAAAFIGTMYDDVRDMESERRRKLVTGYSHEGMHFFAKERRDGNVITGPKAAAPSLMAQEVSEGFGSVVSRRSEEDENGTAPAMGHMQHMARSTAPRRNKGRPSAGRINAIFDGRSSPMSTKTRREKQNSIVAEIDQRATAERRQVEEEQQLARDEPSPAEKQVVVGSCKKPPSSEDQVVQEVPKISLTVEGDDTEYLHAFLTRAKAKRAATAIMRPPSQAGTGEQRQTASSPQTRSRTALAAININSPSPKKTTKLDVQTEKLNQNGMILSDLTAASPLRKSSRNRLPRPQARQAATPSSIPFRRSNGTEFIFLQKTEAQQIAMATRSNTRRNKGEALQPKMKLEALSSQPVSSPTKVGRKRKNSKQVSWDEGLAYFAQAEVQHLESVEEQREEQTPVKRSRRLAGGKGTPAPKKKMAEAAMHTITPTSRTRARTKGRI